MGTTLVCTFRQRSFFLCEISFFFMNFSIQSVEKGTVVLSPRHWQFDLWKDNWSTIFQNSEGITFSTNKTNFIIVGGRESGSFHFFACCFLSGIYLVVDPRFNSGYKSTNKNQYYQYYLKKPLIGNSSRQNLADFWWFSVS